MAKRPDTLETVLLALELLRRIPRNRKVSATELHDQLTNAGLSRDRRTIQRQLEMLSEHFEIERDDRSKPYGYRWKDRASGLSLPVLNEQESLMLALAEQHLRHLLPASLMKSMDGFFQQARTNLTSPANGKRAQEREWLSKVRVVSTTQPLLPPKIKPGVFEAVSNALYRNLWLKLDYKNAAGGRKTANVMPLGLAQQGARLYLVCRYEGYYNERSLALHRVVSAEASTQTFERPKDFDLQKYDADGRFGFGDGKRIHLTFCVDKDAGLHVLESPLSADQQVREIGDQFEISATVVETAQLEWWLRGFGDQVTDIRRLPVSTADPVAADGACHDSS
ncbi:helix-turn-helix transcriptional regulator [Cupriavidus sp. D39]|uniref:helix-turn-helix transcriptional regulator n=1 Tax=Cupriavidus sp. D39 TaxID=2997877 RepID=UPI00226EE118|nr:WYL domain-containing protein [Cupriavidus sp. D39]MCY0854026.1 WYL domain-containing protein [Cupriavidus sp. D39]